MSLDFKNKFFPFIAFNSKPKIQQSSKKQIFANSFTEKVFPNLLLKFTKEILECYVLFSAGRVLFIQHLIGTSKSCCREKLSLTLFNLFILSFNLVFKMFTPRFPLKIEKNEIGIALKSIRRSTT